MAFSGTTALTERDTRLVQARTWLQGLDVEIQSGFQDVAGDASQRRYFRFQADGKSRILMDSPPGDDLSGFIDIDHRLRSAGLHAPEIFQVDRLNGFLLLEDLGNDMFRGLLDEDNVARYFVPLFDVLRDMAIKVDATHLPVFDAKMLRAEMELFPDWYLGHHRKSMPRENFDSTWDSFCNRVIQSALDQPQCFVHRDFHSCNLLKTGHERVGIIDFQDAVKGPVSYDFISLVWDRYIAWSRPQIEKWMEDIRLKLDLKITSQQWLRDCDLMGLQRNIKIVGIFARLNYRDEKNGYIEMIPQFYDYMTGTLRRYPEFSDLLSILEQTECVP